MSGVIACPACGADNMLPDGRTSMFCTYCGKPIEKEANPVSKNTSDDFLECLENGRKLLCESLRYIEIEEGLFIQAYNLFSSIYKKNPSKIIIYKFIQEFENARINIDKDLFAYLISVCKSDLNNGYVEYQFSNELLEYFTKRFKISFLIEEKKQFDFYFDQRFLFINDSSFIKRKEKAEQEFKNKETEFLELLNSLSLTEK